MITLEELLRGLAWYDVKDEYAAETELEPLFLEDIRPQDLPKEDWPKPPPHKRVIIIDI